MPTPYELGACPTIVEVVQRLTDIQAYIAANGPGRPVDGVGCFNALYLTITKLVLDGVTATGFQDNAFMEALDVAFANRYLDALRASVVSPGSVPLPWKVLFDARADREVAELQFAACGVNAHIDFDLAAAIVTTWSQVGGGPGDKDQYATFQQIDKIFAAQMDALRHEYETSGQAALDAGFTAKLLDHFGDWTVDETREIAWGHAARLWKLRHLGLDGPYMDALAMAAGVAGEAILAHL